MLRWRATEHDLANWSDPFRKVKAPRLSKVALPPVELDAVRAMLPKCGPRDKAILLMLLDTGLRADELLSLNLDDVDYRSGAVFVRSGKGSKSRTVFISRNTRQALSAYLGERADLNIALFVNRFGDRLGYWGLHLILESRAADAGVEPPTPHDFRRAFAINALRAGMDVYSLQRLMGHADLQIMRRYLDQVTDDLHRAHTKYSPVDKML
jgi:integrase